MRQPRARRRHPSIALHAVMLIGLTLAVLGLAAAVPAGASASNWAAVSTCGDHTLALKQDGTLWAWGWNGRAQLGLGDTIDRWTPTQVDGATDWAAVSVGGAHTLALSKGGALWAWGWNSYGQLGLGDTTDRWTPMRAGSAQPRRQN